MLLVTNLVDLQVVNLGMLVGGIIDRISCNAGWFSDEVIKSAIEVGGVIDSCKLVSGRIKY